MQHFMKTVIFASKIVRQKFWSWKCANHDPYKWSTRFIIFQW